MDLLELFRTLATFSPPRVSLRDAPWEEYTDWAIANGLGSMAAYNLEYRLAGGDAPEWVRDRLLSIHQGIANDNVMKLVSFKRMIDDLEGRKILLFGAASYAETLYPHMAFRPVPEIRLRVDRAQEEGFVGFLKSHGYKQLAGDDWDGADRAMTDDHSALLVYGALLGDKRREEEAGILDRALPVRVYGSSVFRPDLEDAFLLSCLEQARAGFDAPVITFVDLRELILGSPSVAGAYSRPPRFDVIRERARAWRIDRALYASVSILEALFPETKEAVAQVKPQLSGTSRALLDTLVVQPVSSLGKVRVTRGMDRLRKLLAG